MVRQLTSEHTLLPLGADEHRRWHAGFRHLAAYGAGYYTYLWARSASSRVWQACFAQAPLSRAPGERWCRTVLQHGGAREPRGLLREMLSASEMPSAAKASSTKNEVTTSVASEENAAAQAALLGLVRT